MRKFGKDTPEFFEFQMGGSEKVYRIPTIASLPYRLKSELAKVGTIADPMKQGGAAIEFQSKLLEEYIGEEALEFPADAVDEMFTAWTGYEVGVSQGELSASSELSKDTSQN